MEINCDDKYHYMWHIWMSHWYLCQLWFMHDLFISSLVAIITTYVLVRSMLIVCEVAWHMVATRVHGTDNMWCCIMIYTWICVSITFPDIRCIMFGSETLYKLFCNIWWRAHWVILQGFPWRSPLSALLWRDQAKGMGRRMLQGHHWWGNSWMWWCQSHICF